MVQARVDAVDADGIDTELLEVRQVTGATSGVGKRINVVGRLWETSGVVGSDSSLLLVGNTLDVEPASIGIEISSLASDCG